MMTNEEKAIIDYIEWNITSLKRSEIEDFLGFLEENFKLEFKNHSQSNSPKEHARELARDKLLTGKLTLDDLMNTEGNIEGAD